MIKNHATGILEEELCTCKIASNAELLENIFAVRNGESVMINVCLSTESDVEDWEYEALFDYYDTDILGLTEMTGRHNPVWVAEFPFVDSEDAEAVISSLLSAHRDELSAVFEEIKDKKEDYL